MHLQRKNYIFERKFTINEFHCGGKKGEENCAAGVLMPQDIITQYMYIYILEMFNVRYFRLCHFFLPGSSMDKNEPNQKKKYELYIFAMQ